MPSPLEHKLVRRCNGDGINYEPGVNIQSGWGYKTLNSSALRALNLTKKDIVTINGGGGDGCWDDGHHDGLAVGAIVGIVIGSIVLLILIIGAWILRRRSKNKQLNGGGGGGGGPGFMEKVKGWSDRITGANGKTGDEEKGPVSEAGTYAPGDDPYVSGSRSRSRR